MSNYANMLAWLRQQLARVNCEHEAEWLLLSVLKCSATDLILTPNKAIALAQQQQIQALLLRRLQGEPLAYILEIHDFYGLPLQVSKDVLIPRAATESILEHVIGLWQHAGPQKILELGTGSCAISITLAKHLPVIQIVATDNSWRALSIAKKNINMHNLQKRINLLLADWYSGIACDNSWDVIISNPPYIAVDDLDLCQQVIDFEPHNALYAEDKGLAALKLIITQAPKFLKPAGWLVVEHGYQQASEVQNKFIQAGFSLVQTHQDLDNHLRFTIGRNLSHA